MQSRLRIWYPFAGQVAVALVTLAVSGCGAAATPKAQVKGKVTVNGAPVKGGTILLAPLTASGEAASGEVQSDGTFILSTLEPGDGAPIGMSRLSYKPPVTATEPPEDWDSSKGEPPREKSLYEGMIPKQSEIDVKRDSNEITVELVPDKQLTPSAS